MNTGKHCLGPRSCCGPIHWRLLGTGSILMFIWFPFSRRRIWFLLYNKTIFSTMQQYIFFFSCVSACTTVSKHVLWKINFWEVCFLSNSNSSYINNKTNYIFIFFRFPYLLPCLCISLFAAVVLVSCIWLPVCAHAISYVSLKKNDPSWSRHNLVTSIFISKIQMIKYLFH